MALLQLELVGLCSLVVLSRDRFPPSVVVRDLLRVVVCAVGVVAECVSGWRGSEAFVRG